jgi:hypothetical protein
VSSWHAEGVAPQSGDVAETFLANADLLFLLTGILLTLFATTFTLRGLWGRESTSVGGRIAWVVGFVFWIILIINLGLSGGVDGRSAAFLLVVIAGLSACCVVVTVVDVRQTDDASKADSKRLSAIQKHMTYLVEREQDRQAEIARWKADRAAFERLSTPRRFLRVVRGDVPPNV